MATIISGAYPEFLTIQARFLEFRMTLPQDNMSHLNFSLAGKVMAHLTFKKFIDIMQRSRLLFVPQDTILFNYYNN